MAVDPYDRLESKIDSLVDAMQAVRESQATIIAETRAVAVRAVEDRIALHQLAAKVEELDRDTVKMIDLEQREKRLLARVGTVFAALAIGLQIVTLWIAGR